MTSVQTLPSVHSLKLLHTTSSPVIKPSPYAFKAELASKKMNGHTNGEEGSKNGAPASSSDQVKKHWEEFGAMIQGLLETPIEFQRYEEKEDVPPELKYKALNSVAAKENGNGVAALAKSSFSYGDSPVSRTGTPFSTASTATDADNTVPNDHDLHPRTIDARWPHQGNYGRASGLHNLGNTCFANSVLQVMMHTPPLLRMLDELNEHDGSHRRNGKICLTCELKSAKRGVWGAGKKTYNPMIITTNVKSICPTMRRGRQEDSHEFFRYSVDSLQNETLRELGATKAPHSVRETSWVHKVWGGRLRSRVHCTSCNANSDTFDTFLDLSLDIGKQTASVQDALKGFAREDRLEGKNKYKCEKCNKQVNAIKQMKVVKAPPVLSLHLKRFSPWGKKLTQLIAFDERLELKNPVYEGPPIEYELYGVTLHYGSGPNNGHYISIVRNAKKEWCRMDDSDVTVQQRLSPDDKRNTYQLHYIRKSGDRLAETINQAAKSRVASPSPAKQGRPDLGRSYGASENGSAFDEPGTSQSHAKRAQLEQLQAMKDRQQAEGRGIKRQRDDAQDQGVPLDTPSAQMKKARVGNGNPKFAPVRSEGFYNGNSGKVRATSPEDRDATEDEGEWGDEQNADENEAPGHGSWEGGFDPNALPNRVSRPLQGRSSQTPPSFGFNQHKRGKKEKRRQRNGASSVASPYFASQNNHGGPAPNRRRGHKAMRGKDN